MTAITIETKGTHLVPTIYGIGRNYESHARELNNPVPKGEPVVFLKAPSSIRHAQHGPLAFSDETFHHEIELVVRVSRSCQLGETLNWSVIDAIGLGLDLTRRAAQEKLKAGGLPWTTAKSFAGSAVISEMIPKNIFKDKTHFEFSLTVNDELRQTGNTDQMIFDVPSLLTWLASFNELQEGDLIFTGTPSGVGPIKKGDSFAMTLQEPKRIWAGIL